MIQMPASEYHDARSQYLTSHGLMDYIKSPRMHNLKQAGMMPEQTSKSFTIGSALHMLVLEGTGEFERNYYSPMPGTEPINEKTGKPYGVATKAYTEWLESEALGREVLTPSDYSMIVGMAASVENHEHARALLSDGEPEGVLRCAINGINSQVRIDWFNPGAGIIDLKTITDLDDFGDHFERYNYGLQAAFYQIVAEEVLGQCLPMHFVVVEKAPTHRTGVFVVNSHHMERERRRVEQHIERYAESVRGNDWPTGYEDIRVIGGEA